MYKYRVNWMTMIAIIIWMVVGVLLIAVAMRYAGFEYSTECGIYKAVGWHATIGELIDGVKHINYKTHLNIIDIIRLWNV